MFWNQYEIEEAARAEHACPNVRKGVRFLLKFMEAVNAQSDGWAHWPVPSKAAQKLQELLQTAGHKDGIACRPLSYGTRDTISEADLKKAIAPIRAMVTRAKDGKYGGRFNFDVDAALMEESPFVTVSVDIVVDRRLVKNQSENQAIQHWIENETKWPAFVQNVKVN